MFIKHNNQLFNLDHVIIIEKGPKQKNPFSSHTIWLYFSTNPERKGAVHDLEFQSYKDMSNAFEYLMDMIGSPAIIQPTNQKERTNG
tara:strand:+ start:418 stop:678 length:261 start_codon:yes stop_codon:yes gene_type:complete